MSLWVSDMSLLINDKSDTKNDKNDIITFVTYYKYTKKDGVFNPDSYGSLEPFTPFILRVVQECSLY